MARRCVVEVHAAGCAGARPHCVIAGVVAVLVVQVGNVWQFNATQNMPAANQWRGFFIDFYFPGPAEGFTFRMTTQVSIIPQVFPFPPCSGKACKSFLV